jgi:chromosome segregation ATPase
MDEEGKITMTQFKTVVENFNSKLQSVVEVVQHGFAKLEAKIDSHSEQIAILVEGQTSLKWQVDSLVKGQTEHSRQIALLHEGQTEIKDLLKSKADREEFNGLEARVVKLENKVA